MRLTGKNPYLGIEHKIAATVHRHFLRGLLERQNQRRCCLRCKARSMTIRILSSLLPSLGLGKHSSSSKHRKLHKFGRQSSFEMAPIRESTKIGITPYISNCVCYAGGRCSAYVTSTLYSCSSFSPMCYISTLLLTAYTVALIHNSGATYKSFRIAAIHQPNVHYLYIPIGAGADYFIYYHNDNTWKCLECRSLKDYPSNALN